MPGNTGCLLTASSFLSQDLCTSFCPRLDQSLLTFGLELKRHLQGMMAFQYESVFLFSALGDSSLT
jgi:hypothetical protein